MLVMSVYGTETMPELFLVLIKMFLTGATFHRQGEAQVY
jgi:hypothetical protein